MARGQADSRYLVKVAVELFTPEHAAAVAAFNARMRAGRAPTGFLLPERARPSNSVGSVTLTQYIALDQHGAVRGGILSLEHPARLQGRTERVINVQSPLSEAIIDGAYTFVAPQLIKHVLRQSPHVFVVGMGAATNPLPRLLKAMGWALHHAPFQYRLLRGSRCATRLRPLRSSMVKRVGGAVAAMTGAASLGTHLLHRPAAASRLLAAQFTTEPITEWSNDADRVWEGFAPLISFGVERTTATLPFFYGTGERRPRAWWLKRNGTVEGWFGLLVTPMVDNPYFGDLVVATLTDCIGTPDAMRAGILLAGEQARAAGADLIITNQQHRLLQDACGTAGWRTAPSNYLIAASRALEAAWVADTAYVTRRDGDGLTNLGG